MNAQKDKMKVLANDGISASGKLALEAAGFTVSINTIPQEDLIQSINDDGYEVVLVRSATTIRKDLMDACPNLKMVGRGGVGMDNIDVEYGRSKGIHVFNTPAASSQSVAEMVMAHLFGAVRMLYDANRQMPKHGNSDFKVLKKKYAKGIELRGKTIGIIGFGRIGQALASYALGCGMKVMAHDAFGADKYSLKLDIAEQSISVDVENQSIDQVLSNADVLSFHIPGGQAPVIGSEELNQMKDGVIIANAARGGVIDESALLDALDSGKVAHAALDVFVGEPKPDPKVLAHEKISLSPHVGAATIEAQDRIGTELAEIIINYYQQN